MRRHISVVLFLAMACFSASAKSKSHEWHTGKLIDISKDSQEGFAGGTSHEIQHWYYTIDDGKYVWVLERELHLRHDHPFPATVNGTLKFAVDGHDGYVVDDEGKEHKLSLQKKTVKE